MKRILLTAITCLSLLVALPAVSAAHPSTHRLARDHRPDNQARDRGGDRDRDRTRGDRLEHFRAHASTAAGAVQSLQQGVLTVKLADGSTVRGMVTSATRVSCEAMDQSFSSHDGGPGPNGNGNGNGSGDHGNGSDDHGNGSDDHGNNNGDPGDNGDGNSPSCVAALQRPGTIVHDAELGISNGGAVWQEVDLTL